MPWNAKLKLDYAYEGQRSVARFLHSGPLRILQSLYPEGDAVCHNVLVHPPGGLVGGDQLDMTVCVGRHAHGLVTTPGAARFYRSEGAHACQNLRVKIDEGARLEWLPLETLAYSGCLATNQAVFELAPGAELITWDVTALALPFYAGLCQWQPNRQTQARQSAGACAHADRYQSFERLCGRDITTPAGPGCAGAQPLGGARHGPFKATLGNLAHRTMGHDATTATQLEQLAFAV
jgi:hypothetical protein